MAQETLTFNDDRQEVAGLLASPALDRDDEQFDYDGSKKYFQQWSDAVHAATLKTVGEDNASVGNVRLMHTKQVAGKLIDIKFDDAKKSVWGIAKITDSKVWQDIKSGVYSAFSVGANLVNTAYKEGKKLLTISPVEVSVVDFPSNPDTTFDWIKGTVTAAAVAKFAGSTIPPDAPVDQDKTPPSPFGSQDAMQCDVANCAVENAAGQDYATHGGKKFTREEHAYAPAGSTPSEWKYPIGDAAHVRAALARWGQEKGIPESEKPAVHAKILAAAKKFGIEVSTEKGANTMNLTQAELDIQKAARLSLSDHLASIKKAATDHKEAAMAHEAKVHDLIDKCCKVAGGDMLLAPAETPGGQKVDVGEAVDTAVKAAVANIEKAAKVTTDKLTADLKIATDKLTEIEKAAAKVTGDRTNTQDPGKQPTDAEKLAAKNAEQTANAALAKAAWVNGDAASQRALFKKLAVVQAR